MIFKTVYISSQLGTSNRRKKTRLDISKKKIKDTSYIGEYMKKAKLAGKEWLSLIIAHLRARARERKLHAYGEHALGVQDYCRYTCTYRYRLARVERVYGFSSGTRGGQRPRRTLTHESLTGARAIIDRTR